MIKLLIVAALLLPFSLQANSCGDYDIQNRIESSSSFFTLEDTNCNISKVVGVARKKIPPNASENFVQIQKELLEMEAKKIIVQKLSDTPTKIERTITDSNQTVQQSIQDENGNQVSSSDTAITSIQKVFQENNSFKFTNIQVIAEKYDPNSGELMVAVGMVLPQELIDKVSSSTELNDSSKNEGFERYDKDF